MICKYIYFNIVFRITDVLTDGISNTYIGKSSLDSTNTYIGKISHNFESTGPKLDTFSSKPSKQDEKDKTADEHKISKDNLSPKENFQAANLPSNFKSMDIWL